MKTILMTGAAGRIGTFLRVYPRPDSRYVSKVFNEALASLYADRHGMEMPRKS